MNAILHHAYSLTAKRKLLFAAPAEPMPGEPGYWRLWGDYDHREPLIPEIKEIKKQGMLAEVVITDDDPELVIKTLHRRSAAFHAAGLGPDRRPPGAFSGPDVTARGMTQLILALRGEIAPVPKSPRHRKSRAKKPQEPVAGSITQGSTSDEINTGTDPQSQGDGTG